MVGPFLNFLRNFFIVFFNNNINVKGSDFLHLLIKLPFALFGNSHPSRYKIIPHCGLMIISLMISEFEHLCICLVAMCICLRKCLFGPFPVFKNGVIKMESFACLLVCDVSSSYVLSVNP